MKDTVAIIGSHPGTRDHFDFDRTDCDIWVFNEVLGKNAGQTWCKRADGVFQMHKPMIWRTTTNRNDEKHYEWLQAQDEAVIFMQDEFDDVPKSEKYPLMKIIEKFPTAYQYFTSSVAYSIALAVYKGYKFIELYGCEMETGTEYGHQRVGVAYWIGFAQGLGIYVSHHSPRFWKAPLYGYEGDVQIPIEFYQERMDILGKHRDGIQDAFTKVREAIDELLDRFIVTYKTDLTRIDELIMAFGQNAYNFGVIDGAYQVNEKYHSKCELMEKETGTYLIVRQEFEGQLIAAQKEMPKDQQKTIGIGNLELPAYRKRLNTNDVKSVRESVVKDFKGKLLAYVKAVTDLGRTTGIINENKGIIAKFDELLRNQGLEPGKAEAIAGKVATNDNMHVDI